MPQPPSPFVLVDDSRSSDGRSLLFRAPVRTIVCTDPGGVPAALAEIERALDAGLFAAGYLTYELGYLLEPRLAPLLPADRARPLLWFGLFEGAEALDRRSADAWLEDHGRGPCQVSGLERVPDDDGYRTGVQRVRDYIAAGDVYQVNLTGRYRFRFEGDPLAFYRSLRRRQRVAYGAYVDSGEARVLSLSPELFVTCRDGTVETRPMKGTAARGRTSAEDRDRAAALAGDPKQLAENLMIVDLLRNDVGRVAQLGSVAVPDLFTVETYPTVLQMTSSVSARLRPGAGLTEVISALFPCGSITGAPKIRAMEIIRELESGPRGVYTGAIGFAAPGGQARFNVAIRTVVLDREADGTYRGEMGVGAGIVYDSDPASEAAECRLKARFLTEPDRPFQLIETVRWDGPDEGFALLELHLARLQSSADYFDYPCDRDAVVQALADHVSGYGPVPRRLRLLLDAEGAITVSSAPLVPIAVPLRFAIAADPVDSRNALLFHKTTRRQFYDRTRERLEAERGCHEAVFVNERGELTEGSITNLFVERDGVLLTPALSCGVLDGTLRRALFEDPQIAIEEAILRPADLAGAERIFLGNSVRGLLPAEYVAG